MAGLPADVAPPPLRICDVPPSCLAGVWENGLTAKDIAAARSSCKFFHSLLPEVRLLRAPDIPDNLGPRHQQREPYVDWDSETFPEGNIRSITVACEWRDQGWGYRKGHFVLQLMRGQSEVVAEVHRPDQLLGIAPHERGNASVTLWPDNPVVSMAQQGDHLRVLKVVGGGGGHRLAVSNFTVSLVFESEFTPVSDRRVELEFP